MQQRGSGQGGQRLVQRVAAQVRPQLHRVQGTSVLPLQKAQVRPVGVVHQQRNAVGVRDLRDALDVGHHPKIVRRGDVDCAHIFFPLQRRRHIRRGDAADQPLLSVPLRVDPHRFQPQQGHRVDRRRVDVAPGNHLAAFPRHQPQHRLDAEGGAARADHRRAGAVKLCENFFQFLERAIVLEQAVGSLHLGQVVGGKRAERLDGRALVPGHVQPRPAGVDVLFQRPAQRGLSPFIFHPKFPPPKGRCCAELSFCRGSCRPWF